MNKEEKYENRHNCDECEDLADYEYDIGILEEDLKDKDKMIGELEEQLDRIINELDTLIYNINRRSVP